MSLTLKQTDSPRQRIDLRGVLPADIEQIDPDTLLEQPIALGKRQAKVRDLFSLEGQTGHELIILPLDNRLDYLGQGLRNGVITVKGSVGHHVASAMQGGRIVIHGDCGDHAGSALRNGELIVQGNAGKRLGAPPAGERQGQRGGLIHIRGNVGERAGELMRRGLLVIDGNAGNCLGYRMIAGSIYLAGRPGERTGLDMRRGTLICRQQPANLGNTFRYNGHQTLGFLPLLLKQIGSSTQAEIRLPEGNKVERYLGDIACGGQGEILVLS